MNAKFLFVIFVLCVTRVTGQTAAEIEEAYGKPTLAYSVTNNIWMTPDFAADGQVCRMRFYPKRVIRGVPFLSGYLSHAEMKWILNQIAPPSSRGNLKPGFGIGTFGGGVAEAEYEYEKVTFSFSHSANIRIDPEALKNSELVDLDFPIPAGGLPKPTPRPASESDFDESGKPEIAVVRWNDRTCVEEDEPNELRLAEIEQRFGPPQKIYSVGTFISMTPVFATDGQMCQMWVFPKRVSGADNYLGTTLEFDKLRFFLNTLVPPEQRGLKQLSFGSIVNTGRVAWTTYSYENVEFTFMNGPKSSGSTYSKPPPPGKTLSLVDSVRRAPENRHPSADDFPRAETEIVNVRWQRRTCGGLR
jgi:hypothetical protein